MDTSVKCEMQLPNHRDFNRPASQDNEGKPCIHVIAPAQPPVVRHPETGEPVWFCNVHSHSDYLRQQREERDGTLKVGLTCGV